MLKTFRWVGILAFAVFLISVSTPVWNRVGGLLAVPAAIGKADAIVVLGAGVRIDGTLGDESLRRHWYGMQLFKQGLAPVLVLVGPPHRERPALSEAEVRRALAIQFGIPPEQVLAVGNVWTTRDESLRVASALAERRANTVLLVTSSVHMRRAMRLFDRAGLRVLPAPSDDIPNTARSPGDRFWLMMSVLSQGLALLQHRIAGYI
jgi:uncharacterized SAM-binding protein YcdF (DUF218 family)